MQLQKHDTRKIRRTDGSDFFSDPFRYSFVQIPDEKASKEYRLPQMP